MSIINIIKDNFRIIALSVLLILIVGISSTLEEKPETLNFNTYEFNLEGNGTLDHVKISLDFDKGVYQLATVLEPGNYTVHGNSDLNFSFSGKASCTHSGDNTITECLLQVPSREEVIIFFDREMLPNGHFMFYFFNETFLNLTINFGETYSFIEVDSVFPKDIHGQYYSEDTGDKFQFRTYDHKEYARKSSFIDFDLYSINKKNQESNKVTKWKKDILIVPLMVSFLIVLVDEILTYAHRQIKKKYK